MKFYSPWTETNYVLACIGFSCFWSDFQWKYKFSDFFFLFSHQIYKMSCIHCVIADLWHLVFPLKYMVGIKHQLQKEYWHFIPALYFSDANSIFVYIGTSVKMALRQKGWEKWRKYNLKESGKPDNFEREEEGTDNCRSTVFRPVMKFFICPYSMLV